MDGYLLLAVALAGILSPLWFVIGLALAPSIARGIRRMAGRNSTISQRLEATSARHHIPSRPATSLATARG